jgi:hypothetical protein
MSCNCENKNITGDSKFGTCLLCMYITIAGFICSWVLLIPFIFIKVDKVITYVLAIPAIFFTIWLSIHLLAYYKNKK